MRNMRSRLLTELSTTTLLLLAILTCAIPPRYSQAQVASDLKFTASLDKGKYMVNEIIWLTLWVQNLSEDKVYGLSIEPVYGNIYFHLLSAEGETLRGEWLQGTYMEIPTLGPREKDMISVNFLATCWFGVENEEAIFYQLLPEGEYILQVELRVRPHPKWQKERFSIFSDQLKFKVERPNGEEKNVYDLLVQGYREFRKENEQGGVDLLKRTVNQYPHSAYVDAAYWRLPFIFYHQENIEKYIASYPNSGFVWQLLRLHAPEQKDKRKKFFEEVIKKYPDTKASAYGEILLDKWGRGKLWEDNKDLLEILSPDSCSRMN